MKCDGCGKEMKTFDFITGTAKNNNYLDVEFKTYCGKCAVYLDIKNQVEIDNIIERDLWNGKLDEMLSVLTYEKERNKDYPLSLCGVPLLSIIKVLNFLIKKRRIENNC